MYSKDHLLKALSSGKEIASVWAAYQLLSLYPEEVTDHLEQFLDSSIQDIQIAGIAKIAETLSEEYAPRLLYLFRESSSSIKQAAALTLSQFPNDLSISVLGRWLDDLVSNNNSTRGDLHSAVNAFLNCSAEKHLDKIIQTIQQYQDDLFKSTILFQEALKHCDSLDFFNQLLDLYFQLRDRHSDTELPLQLVQMVGHWDLIEWLLQKMEQGYPLVLFYEQSYKLLGKGISLKEHQIWDQLQQNLFRLESSDKTQETVQSYLENLKQWTKLYSDKKGLSLLQKKILWLVDGFTRNSKYFLGTIPKILDIEKAILTVLPVIFQMEASLKEWLTNPKDYLQEIADYYHSFLLTIENREEILKLFFPTAPKWSSEQLKIIAPISVRLEESPHQVIWSLYRGELLGKNISWPSIFPTPDVSQHLIKCLQQIYLANFDWFIQCRDSLSIDYALQLFQADPSQEMIDAMKNNFSYLQQHHTEVFYQAIEFLPSEDFFQPLIGVYQPGEYEVSDLILLICELFDLDIPDKLKNHSESEDNPIQGAGLSHRIRLHCSECNHTYKYPVSIIYVDEEALLRFNDIQTESVWVDQSFNCKNCSITLPFDLDQGQLEEIASQSRMDKFLKTPAASNRNSLGRRIRIIPFPQFDGKIYPPDKFNNLIQFHEEQNTDQAILNTLYIRQVRVYEILERWTLVSEILNKAVPNDSDKIEILTKKGIAAYKQNNLLEARTNLQAVVKEEEEVGVDERELIFLMEAKNYLDLMDSRSTDKARFKIIRGNK